MRTPSERPPTHRDSEPQGDEESPRHHSTETVGNRIQCQHQRPRSSNLAVFAKGGEDNDDDENPSSTKQQRRRCSVAETPTSQDVREQKALRAGQDTANTRHADDFGIMAYSFYEGDSSPRDTSSVEDDGGSETPPLTAASQWVVVPHRSQDQGTDAGMRVVNDEEVRGNSNTPPIEYLEFTLVGSGNNATSKSWVLRWLCGVVVLLLSLNVAAFLGLFLAYSTSNTSSSPSSSTPKVIFTLNPTPSPRSTHDRKIETIMTIVVDAMSALTTEAGRVTWQNLQDNSTAQARAAHWMATEDKLDDDVTWFMEMAGGVDSGRASPQRHQRLLERYAMTVLYMLRPDHSKDLIRLQSKPTCDWQLVTTSANTDDSCLEVIVASKKHLSGPIPPELALIRSLRRLYLGQNQLTGSLPSVWGHGLSNLNSLSCAQNAITGSIPPSWGKMTMLLWLDLSHNIMHSPNWPNTTNRAEEGPFWLESLRTLELHSNLLNVTLPENIGRVLPDNFENLMLGKNNLVGTIPSSLADLAHLKTLHLNENALEGSIPPALFQAFSLRVLRLGDNELTGTALPAESRTPTKLQDISLRGNRLTGTLPAETTTTRWATVDLSSNDINGSIPESFGGWSLSELRLGSNKLSGTIPPSIWNVMTKLRTLDVSNNVLSGTIPSPPPKSNSKGRSLISLNLASNSLSGKLPSLLPFSMEPPKPGDIRNKAVILDFSQNLLTGTIPSNLVANGSKLAIVRLQRNLLSGTVPENLLELLPSLEEFNIRKNRIHGNITFLCSHHNRLKIVADCQGPDAPIVCDCCEDCR